MITIVDYGMGNLGSIRNMLKKIGAESKISADINEISQAKKLILPGVGAFDTAMQNLANLGLIEVLHKKVLEQKTPLLGICLGMQLLAEGSEEGQLPGLGWIKGENVRFRFNGHNGSLKVPHMGWNTVKIKEDDVLLKGFDQEPRFYFVHSFHMVCKKDSDSIGETNYGYEFTSVVHQDNVLGAQFHPEKSHKFGMKLLKNFVDFEYDAKN